jgi:hypothetical protein
MDLFWLFAGAGVFVFGVFAGLSLVIRAAKDHVQMTFRDEEEE